MKSSNSDILNDKMNDTLLRKQEVMEILNISRKHFEKLVNSEKLPMIKITPYKRFVRLSHLNEYLDSKTINKPSGVNPETPDSTYQWKPVFKRKRTSK